MFGRPAARKWQRREGFKRHRTDVRRSAVFEPQSDGWRGTLCSHPDAQFVVQISPRRIDVSLPFCVLVREWYSWVRRGDVGHTSVSSTLIEVPARWTNRGKATP